jgi:hypothetical protein
MNKSRDTTHMLKSPLCPIIGATVIFFFKRCVFGVNSLFFLSCDDGSWIARGIDGGRLLAVLYESNAAAFHTAYSLQ